MRMVWYTDKQIGVEAVDAGYRRIDELIARAAQLSAVTPEYIQAVVDAVARLIEAETAHFNAVGRPLAPDHLAAHRHLLETLRAWQKVATVITGLTTLSNIQRAVNDHFCRYDRRLSGAVAQQQPA